jgi:hypothetical protein
LRIDGIDGIDGIDAIDGIDGMGFWFLVSGFWLGKNERLKGLKSLKGFWFLVGEEWEFEESEESEGFGWF